MKTHILYSMLLCLFLIILTHQPAQGQESLSWMRAFGGKQVDTVNDVATDSEGAIYVTGWFQEVADFDGTGINGQGGEVTASSNISMYLAKYDVDGNFIWAVVPEHFDADNDCSKGKGVAVGPDDGIFITGVLSCLTDFDGPAINNQGGEVFTVEPDMFASKYDANGTFQWVRTIPDAGHSFGSAIAIGDDGSPHITGAFSNTADFDGSNTTGQGGELQSLDGSDVFVAKYNAQGTFLWAQGALGKTIDEAFGIALGSDGSVFITGWFFFDLDFDGIFATGQGGEIAAGPNGSDLFLAKYDASGVFQWVQDTDQGAYASSSDIATGPNNSAYITGALNGNPDFDGPAITGQGGETNIQHYDELFVAKYSEDGTFDWVITAGGKEYDRGLGLDVTSIGSVYVTGDFQGEADFDGPSITGEGGEVIGKSRTDLYLVKYDVDGNFQWVKTGVGPGGNQGTALVKEPSGNTVVVGNFESDLLFEQSTVFANNGSGDFFIAQFSRPTPGPTGEISPFVVYEAEVHEFVHPEDIVTTLIDSQGDKMSFEEVYITAVTSDEPLTSKGDETADDILFKDCQIIGLRPELAYNSNGRVYTLYMAVTDKYGETGAWQAEVHVLSNGMKEAIKDEAEYKVEVCPDGLPTGPQPVITTTELIWKSTGEHEVASVQDVVKQVLDSNGKEMPVDAVIITSVTSDEPETGEGDKTTDDIVAGDCQTLKIRQEAVAGGNGRVYTMHLAVTDELGYTGTAEARVHVVTDGASNAMDDGAAYAVEVCPLSQKSMVKSEHVSVGLGAYPNPFNPQTTITLSVAQQQEVDVRVFDVLGRQVALIHQGQLEAHPSHQFTFDASTFPSGVYLIRALGEQFVLTQRITLVK